MENVTFDMYTWPRIELQVFWSLYIDLIFSERNIKRLFYSLYIYVYLCMVNSGKYCIQQGVRSYWIFHWNRKINVGKIIPTNDPCTYENSILLLSRIDTSIYFRNIGVKLLQANNQSVFGPFYSIQFKAEFHDKTKIDRICMACVGCVFCLACTVFLHL